MKRWTIGLLGGLLCFSATVQAAGAKYATAKHNIVLEGHSPATLKVWNKPADENSGKPAMVFENGWEPEGVLLDGTNCVHRIEFFSASSTAEQVAALSYYNKNPKCGPVEKRADGAIGEFAYYDSNSQLIKQWLYER